MITTSRDFCLYLAGAIDGATSVDEGKVATINQRLQAVLNSKSEKGSGNVYLSFCKWLDGLIDGRDENAGLNSSRVEKVRTRLSELLGEDSPDSSAGEDEQDDEPIMRC